MGEECRVVRAGGGGVHDPHHIPPSLSPITLKNTHYLPITFNHYLPLHLTCPISLCYLPITDITKEEEEDREERRKRK